MIVGTRIRIDEIEEVRISQNLTRMSSMPLADQNLRDQKTVVLTLLWLGSCLVRPERYSSLFHLG